MKNQITSREYELLSAYLDNQLDPKNRAHLESRLKLEPELRHELRELDETRLLLHSLPRLRAPRNYFIRPEMTVKPIRVRQTFQVAPAYGIISAIATILLVLVIFGDRLLSATSPVALAPASMAPTVAMEQILEIELSVPATSAPAEAAPKAMMEAPILDTQPPPSSDTMAGAVEQTTPTTIYLNAYPPSATPEGFLSYLDQIATSTPSCEEFLANANNQILPQNSYCPTPTDSAAIFLQSIQDESLPITVTIDTSIPTITPSPSFSPTSTTSATPTPTATQGFIQEAVPEARVEAPLLPAPTEPVLDNADTTSPQSITAEGPESTPNLDFIQYPILAIEMSLAAVAIITGIIAIILRMRSGR